MNMMEPARKCPAACHVNLRLMPVKVTFFFVFGGLACLLPYIPIYMRQIGLSPIEIAIIYSTMSVACAPVRIVIGIIADKLHRHKTILLLCCVISGVFHLCMLWIPPDVAMKPTVEPAHQRIGHLLCDVEKKVQQTSLGNTYEIVLCFKPSSGYMNNETALNDTQVGTAHPRWTTDDWLGRINETRDASSNNCSLSCCSLTNKRHRISSTHDLDQFHSVNLTSFNETSDRQQLWSASEFFSEACEPVFNLSVIPTFNTERYNYESKYESCEQFYYVEAQESQFCDPAEFLECSVTCPSSEAPGTLSPVPQTTHSKFNKTFLICFLLFLFGQASFAPVLSMSDTLTYMYLGEEHRREYGKQRLWGTVAFGVCVVLSGFVMDVTSVSSEEKNFTFPYVALLVFLALAAISVCFYRHLTKPVEAIGNSMLKNMRLILKRLEVWILLFSLLVVGLLAGVQETYFFYFVSTLKANQLLLGLSLAGACIGETLVLFASGFLLKRLGHYVCLIIVFVVFGIRLLAYSFLYEPWWVILTELLHSVCFGLLYPTATSYGSSLAPESMQGTMQGLIGACYFSIGRAVGQAIGGVLYEAYGPRRMFMICAILSFFYALCLIIFVIVKRQRKKSVTSITRAITIEVKEENGIQEGLKEEATINGIEKPQTLLNGVGPHRPAHVSAGIPATRSEIESLVENVA